MVFPRQRRKEKKEERGKREKGGFTNLGKPWRRNTMEKKV
jgi:hypothetical protein